MINEKGSIYLWYLFSGGGNTNENKIPEIY